MAAQLFFTEEQRAEYKKGFSAFDKNDDGTITIADLGAALKSVGQSFTEAELETKIRKVGSAAGDGTITFPEFLSMIADEMREGITQYRKAFRALDKDGNKLLSDAELRQAILTVDPTMKRWDIDAMIEQAGGRDGKVDYGEFVEMMIACTK